MTVGIIGLGLMGGSFAMAIKKLTMIKKIRGFDHNKEHEKEALSLNLVDEIVSFEEIKQADVIILAIPVDGIIASLKDLQDVNKNTTIIDLGSTKERIVSSIPVNLRKNVVAAHPMTGTEKFGPSAAFDDLYKDKVVVLCDLENSGQHQQETAVRLFSGIHMKLVYMKAHEHDLHVAFISHMPHLISYALANSVLQHEEHENILNLAAGGFRSMSRLAKSSPNMWGDIFRQNKTHLLDSLSYFEKELALMKKMVQEEKWDRLDSKMKDANSLHDILK
ncbi:prephenate dehydrogenase [Sulfurimonas sp. MAG313]|nr:prephenate dehydrogenase [Sulfurimonas sp. MAG313]MDF1881128.1 prephenate dehydrogenase [Sulfurimonas sp. MAG313]